MCFRKRNASFWPRIGPLINAMKYQDFHCLSPEWLSETRAPIIFHDSSNITQESVLLLHVWSLDGLNFGWYLETYSSISFSSANFPWSLYSRMVVSNSLWHHATCQASLSFTISWFCSNSCPLSWWCHPTTSSSVVPFSSCLQSFPASGSFLMSWLFSSGDQSIGASALASVLPIYIQDWFPLGLTDLISLLSKGLSRVFSSTTVWKHLFFGAQPSLWSNSHIHTWLLEKP